MTLLGVVLSVIGQFFFSGLLWGVVLATALTACDKLQLSSDQSANLDWALIILPVQCLIIAGCMLWWFFQDAGSEVYHWHWLPVVSALCYLAYIRYLFWTCPKTPKAVVD